MNSQSAIQCRDLCKSYKQTRAVCGVQLQVEKGKFIALLGESGCGKTTVLRLMAGFETPDRGEIVIGNRTVSNRSIHIAPEKRNIGMVFQEYALFPHMNVENNVGYGLPKDAQRQNRIEEVLELVGLKNLNARMPYELSGGQQQRVAIARALAPEPDLILLDEPFSNLDSSLRNRVRSEVRHILRQAGVTAIFVTHDQEEALSLADKIAIMMNGRIAQTDSPQNLYLRPANREIATFLGEANLLGGDSSGHKVTSEIGELHSETNYSGKVEIMIRPEHISLTLQEKGPGQIVDIEYFGHDQLIDVKLSSGTIIQSRVIGGNGTFGLGKYVSLKVQDPVITYPQSNTLRSCSCA